MEITTHRCEHLQKAPPYTHGHLVVMGPGDEYLLCEGCYERLSQSVRGDGTLIFASGTDKPFVSPHNGGPLLGVPKKAERWRHVADACMEIE